MQALVIDDSRAVRMILGNILGDLGFTVNQACNGQEGLDKILASAPPDLVLVDWHMPEMDGLTFVKNVRSHDAYSGVPVMMVTSDSEMGKVVQALEAGANEYVMKPFTKEMIAEKLALIGLYQG